MKQQKLMIIIISIICIAVFLFWRGDLPVHPALNEKTAHPNDLEALYLYIQQEAEKLNQAPIDARIDRIWKAIPGYNGMIVDVEQTFLLASQFGIDRSHIPFIYQEIPPTIGLDDLPAHPIYKGNSRKPMASIMINVAWGNEYIPAILATLKEENVRCTFFLDGSWLKNNTAIAEQILREGHELSNHAYSHRDMSDLSAEDAYQEIKKTQDLLTKLGVKNELFAPPSGDFDQQTVQIADQLGLRTILWTIDTIDWKKPSAATIVQRISSRLEPGALILMHPTKPSSEALPTMIQAIKNRGFALGTVTQLISPERVTAVESAVIF